MNNSTKGLIAEQKVIMRALEKGYCVSKPISHECRYDLIVDDHDRISRAQVKYAGSKAGEKSTGSVTVNLRTWSHSENASRRKCKVYAAGEIDAVIAYVPQVDKLVWIPPMMFVNKKTVVIRYAKPKNNQRCHMVEDFEW